MELDDELATGVHLSPTRNVDKDGEIVRRWMEMVLGEKFQSDLPSALRSGELMCDLVNKMYKALGMKSQISPVRASALPPQSTAGEAGEATSGRDDTASGCDTDALKNVLEYISACEVLGVARQDLFQPDDLLRFKNMEKVYSNILALQAVAVALSNRRSIDERSSIVASQIPEWSPMSEHGVFAEDEELEMEDFDLDSPETISLLQQTRWQRLLFEYEYQQQRKEERDLAGDSSASEGLGPLAHDIWRTEERIRALLIRDDRDYGSVPEELHGKLWMLASGAQMEMRRHKGQYQRLLSLEMDSTESTRQIDVDLHRTVPDEDKAMWSEEKSKMMRRVLVAYSFYNPNLGYCQGLNYIVARSLQFLGEEETFYLLLKMVRVVPDDYYTTMLGLAVDQHVYADLVRLQFPEVADHLTELGGSGMELSLACTEWFLTLFASPCARDVTFQIWDSVFLLGDETLFRAALALLQQARPLLLECKTYGDMLKHLNEIGREGVDALTLMKLARKQDCVIRGRVEDFRAHHRLQLASGIVASSVEAEDARSSTTGRRSSESRSEPRLRLFGARKNKSIFRHLDKSAGRHSRTFERNLTEEYAENLRKEHPNITKYYEGMQLKIEDGYWGSAESYRQWGAKNVRRIEGGNAVSSCPQEVEGRRMKSDTNLLCDRENSRQAEGCGSAPVKGLSRERRSKSSAFIYAKRNPTGSTSIPNNHSTRSGDYDDSQAFGRSPLAWIQRFEEWHKDMKVQKEKKRAEKQRQKQSQRSDGLLFGARNAHGDSTTSTPRVRDAIESSPLPYRPYPNSMQSAKRSIREQRRKSNGYQNAKPSRAPMPASTMAGDLALSRSFSDPFNSPLGAAGLPQWHNNLDKARHDEMNQQILIRSQNPDKHEEFTRGPVADTDFDAAQKAIKEQPEDTKTRYSSEDKTVKHLPVEQKAAKRGLSTRSQTPATYYPACSAAKELLYSPVHYRSCSVDYPDEASFTASTSGPPAIRRNVSVPVPVGETKSVSQQRRLRNPKRMNSENAQAIRDRANVVSYMHRKASDTSSIAGSIPRSPHDRMDMARMSGSSSDSSRFGDYALNSTRSGKSKPYRKSSFSFFDKLSSDLESCADSLDSPFPDDDLEFKADTNGHETFSSTAGNGTSSVDQKRNGLPDTLSISMRS